MLTDSPKLCVCVCVCDCTCSGCDSIVKDMATRRGPPTHTGTEVWYNHISPGTMSNCLSYTHVHTHTHARTHIRITLSLATVFHSGCSICFDQYMESDLRPVQCLLLTNKGSSGCQWRAKHCV